MYTEFNKIINMRSLLGLCVGLFTLASLTAQADVQEGGSSYAASGRRLPSALELGGDRPAFVRPRFSWAPSTNEIPAGTSLV